jgi:thymidylate synthase (FAD)
LSFSVVSQRYVDYSATRPVIPPAVAEVPGMAEHLEREYDRAVKAYEDYVETLRGRGLSRKAAREAARAVLPNAAPVDMIVTGNLRAWRDVLGKRWHVAADAEMREFAGLILGNLRRLAPGSVQDIPTEPYGG